MLTTPYLYRFFLVISVNFIYFWSIYFLSEIRWYIMRLKPLWEIAGTLTAVNGDGEGIKLVFGIEKQIQIPLGAIPLERLKGFQDKHIGIFNNGGNYLIREIKVKVAKIL